MESSSQSRRKRKRQCENATMAALDLPDIPGVPLDVIPELVHAIRVGTKFYAKCHGRAYCGEEQDQEFQNHTVRTNSSCGVLGSIMDRMAVATTEQIVDPEQEELSKRRNAMNDAAGRWLESLKRFVKRDDHRKKNREQMPESIANTEKDGQRKFTGPSVPFACFVFIWDLQKSHERIAVRRASLYLTGLLLQRSKDCRLYLEQDDHLGQWLDDTFFDYQPQKAVEDLPFLQWEGDFWLNHLVEKGYGRIYPKIQVAVQRLRQRCPTLEAMNNVSSTFSDSTSSINDWRRIRDVALINGEKEIKYVEKWLSRAYTYMEILVPRLGVITEGDDSLNHKSEKCVERRETNTKNDDDEEEEDDVDWEDADDFNDDTANAHSPDLDHFYAVERTLAAMESSGLRDGAIEIDFRDNPEKKAADEMDMKRSDTVSEEERRRATAKLRDCLSILAKTHLPRIALWMEGLTNADNLVVRNRSLVSLTSDVATKRSDLLNRLVELRGNISGVLSSAKQLQFDVDSHATSERQEMATRASDDAPLILRLSAPVRKQASGRDTLQSTIQHKRKRKAQGTRSNKIRIKCYPR